jgi:hypothetical protein
MVVIVARPILQFNISKPFTDNIPFVLAGGGLGFKTGRST